MNCAENGITGHDKQLQRVTELRVLILDELEL